ncbi:ribosome biogenesis protein BOP1 homolog [Ricinus communis]|uniref:ribosome biogenesis protein BOP1 homolog n=1 Tax=Ricinus communis TaxID=3988 RepID=UPI000772B417|nr:ribosome biogenesis protein BOP1 homolog [Ricinus communis]|eukprot:XP_015580760.1 ribosome biogenesis protein BOP1 homolog [Ricinus communis]
MGSLKSKNKNDKNKQESIKNQSKKEKVNSREPEGHKKEEEQMHTHLDSESDSDYQEFSDSEDEYHGSSGASETGESNSSGDEGSVDTDNNDDIENEDQSEGLESDQAAEESDSSEDEVAPRNTIGDVPLKWYEDEKHIGYDIAGKKITKKERQDKLESFLASADDSENWRKIYDEYNDEVVELTKEEMKVIRRLVKGKAPHFDFDPYPTYSDWFKWDSKHPLSNAPEPKRRFTPSKWEAKKVVKYVRAIRKGLIKFDKPKEEPRFHLLWGDDSGSAEKTGHLSYIPAPKPKLPGHEESYNPSLEFIPTQEEINSYQLMDEEDRPKFIPKRFTSLRSIPAYENAMNEAFERCLDLYLCPRVRKKRINIDPESLKPKLPSRKDLRPYPATCYIEYRGHTGAVMSISTEASGAWIASGSNDGTVRIWEVETGRCLRIWELGEAVQCVAWNPLHELPILAIAVGQDVIVLNTGLGNAGVQKQVKELLHVSTPTAPDDPGNGISGLSWHQDEKHEGIRIRHFKTVSSVEWHRKGDYFCTLMPAGESRAVLIHQLSKKLTQRLPFKLHGLPVSSVFHPTRSVIFVATKKNVRAFDLLKHKLIKKLETGLREVSSIAVHPAGDNIIVGSREGKLCWFDMDLSSKPYKVLKCHPKDITNVAFHRSYPLFASSSEDCTAYVFHGMVYSDLNQNPLIVPLEILRGHSSSNGRGTLDCKFHPRQPWLFTAGADSLIKLYCH